MAVTIMTPEVKPRKLAVTQQRTDTLEADLVDLDPQSLLKWLKRMSTESTRMLKRARKLRALSRNCSGCRRCFTGSNCELRQMLGLGN